MQTSIFYPPTAIPILRSVDAAIFGGSFGGIAAALRLARAGKKTLLLEPRTYLGSEITASLRYWLPADIDQPHEIIQAVIKTAGISCAEGIALHPDRLKLCLEDILLEAGVELIYGCLPVGAFIEEGRFCGWVIGGKFGRAGVHCGLSIDATESGAGLRAAGVSFEPPTPLLVLRPYRRILEFTGVGVDLPPVLEIPPHLGVLDHRLIVHAGWLGKGHLLLECPFLLPEVVDLTSSMRAERESRRRILEVAAHLFAEVPAFRYAVFTASSYELSGIVTNLMRDDSIVQGELRLPNEPNPLPLNVFASTLAGLWCLSPAVRLENAQRERFCDPIFTAAAGDAIANALIDGVGNGQNTEPSPTDAKPVPSSRTAPILTVREPTNPPRPKNYDRHNLPQQVIPLLRSVDLLVVGGGTSGAAAAFAAAAEGVDTILIEANPGLGGTSTFGGVDSHWYGRKVSFAASTQKLVDELHAKFRHAGGARWNLQAKTAALEGEVERLGVECFFNTFCIGVVMEGEAVRGVIAASRYGIFSVLGQTVIDATGDADVAYFAGALTEYGSPRDHLTMWYSLPQFIAPGETQNNFTSTVYLADCEDFTRAVLAGRRRGGRLADHGVYVAPRESRRIIGEVQLTLTDILRRREWQDVINIHFSNYDVKGKSETDWTLLGFIPPNLEMEIPYRCLFPKGIENLLVVGKAISVSHDALPAVRMQADLENLGGAAGLAAVHAIRAGISPRQINVRQLQGQLVKEGLLPPEVLTRTIQTKTYSPVEIDALVESLDAEKPLYAYSDMEMDEVYRGIIPLVEIGALGEQAVPALERALQRAEGRKKLMLAQLLAFCGSKAGVPVLIDAIRRDLSGERLPPRTSAIRHSEKAPPDQAAMPDTAYLIYSLGMARDQRSLTVWQEVADLLEFSQDDLRDPYQGVFFYVDAVCDGAERLGEPMAVPILEQIADHPLLHGQVCRGGFQVDFIPERQAMLEIALGRALARCGSSRGYRILIAYLEDTRALLALGAHDELVHLSGQDFGEDVGSWERWLRENKDRLEAKPREE